MKLEEIEKVINSAAYRPKIRLVGNGSVAILELKHECGTVIKVTLEKRYIQLLLLLSQALCEKDDFDEWACGWLTNEQIAQMYVDGNPNAFTPEPSLFSAYRAHINRRIREATNKILPGVDPPILFVTVRNLGVRLISELEIIKC